MFDLARLEAADRAFAALARGLTVPRVTHDAAAPRPAALGCPHLAQMSRINTFLLSDQDVARCARASMPEERAT
jgi:hypothetical protein